MPNLFILSSYDYILPEDRIAHIPASPADTSRLLVRESDGTVRDTVFHTLPDEIEPDRVMFFNNSKVIRSRIVLSGARLVTRDGREKVFDGEIFFLEEVRESNSSEKTRESDSIWMKKEHRNEAYENRYDEWGAEFLNAKTEAISCFFKAMVYPGDYFPIGWTVYFRDIAFRVEEMVYEGRILRMVHKKVSTISVSWWESPEKWSHGLDKSFIRSGDMWNLCENRAPEQGVLGSTMSEGAEIWAQSSHFAETSPDIWQVLEHYGQLPLPPYIEYSKEKEWGYQSIFAEKRGSLAAPTASLHFTPRVLDGLAGKWIEQHTVTLHVGLGTFKNIYEEDIRDYVMHAERAEVPVSIFETIANRKHEGKTILAVGTTVTRTLESLPYLWRLVRDRIECQKEIRDLWDATSLERETNPLSSVSFSPDGKTLFFSSALFIYGKYSFQVVDEIITNFHLPKSTLFILVSSFLGLKEAKKLYTNAIGQKYRFFSFGDAMYLKSEEK